MYLQSVAEDVLNKSADGDQARTIGRRLARIRQEQGITQEELAERLGTIQPIVSDYERGRLRLHGSMLINLARVLRVSADEILGLKKPKKGGSELSRRLVKRMRKIQDLPERDQQTILRTIDSYTPTRK